MSSIVVTVARPATDRRGAIAQFWTPGPRVSGSEVRVAAKSAKVVDRRVERTRRALQEALMSLLLARSWDEISVQDVCDRADVGRSTFYTHFADKDEMLTSGLADLRKALRAQQRSHPAPDRPLGFSRGLIEHAHENRLTFRALLGKRGGHVVQAKFRELVRGVVREDLSNLAPRAPHLDAAIAYVSGAFMELLTWWVETSSPLSAEDLDRVFHHLTSPVLEAMNRR